MSAFSGRTIAVICGVGVAAFLAGWFTASQRSNRATIKSESVSSLNPKTQPGTRAETQAHDESRSLVHPGLSASLARAALEQLDLTPGSEQREDERLKLLVAWAGTDPLGALEYAKQNLKADRLAQALSGIATEWAKNDPGAAWKWARSLGSNDLSQVHTVLEEIGRNNTGLATQFVTELARSQPDEAVAVCITAMRGMTYDGNFEAALKLATEIKLRSPEEQATLLNFMAGQWARFEPDKTAQWVQSLPEGQMRNQALIGLGESWAEINPPAAADFAAQLPPGQSRQTALQQAIANWILTDPAQAATWVNQFPPHEDFDQAVASVATMRYLMEEHVDMALNWAETISGESLRTATLNEILSNWAAHDRVAALNYIKSSSGLTDQARVQLLRQLQSGAN